ncbi:hypothetical protein CSC94_11050 [Zhengella mangrovi]|uniref:Uncharacterized protein n=1 Tax=Zhengella mangrovi TaxID=1982044 RepID=A0A2G1QNM6_9HYPH|nr:hypothetical protein CSC94_11050 [Zhengella mangrovi]
MAATMAGKGPFRKALLPRGRQMLRQFARLRARSSLAARAASDYQTDLRRDGSPAGMNGVWPWEL